MEGPATSTVVREEVAENVAVRSVGGGGVRARNLSVVSSEGDTVVKLHKTNIVIARANGDIELSSGGWRTFQTLKGINQSLRSVSGLQVVADGPVAEGSWRVTNGTEWSTPFVDGMTVPGFDAACSLGPRAVLAVLVGLHDGGRPELESELRSSSGRCRACDGGQL